MLRSTVLAVLFILVSAVAPVADAQIANKQQVCKTYADTAVLAYKSAIKIKACGISKERLGKRNARWHPDQKVHFDWCMAGGNWQAERDARDAVLNKCDPAWRPRV